MCIPVCSLNDIPYNSKLSLYFSNISRHPTNSMSACHMLALRAGCTQQKTTNQRGSRSVVGA